MATTKVAVDAGAGDDTVTLGAAIAAGSTINLGAGDDALLTDGGSVAASAVIDGGDGFDTVSAALINAGNAAQFHNFEALNLSSSSAVTLDVNLLTHSTIEALTLSGGNQAATVSNVAAGVNLLVSGQNSVATTINVKDAAIGTADAFSVAFNGTGDSSSHSANVVVNGIENLSVESAGMGSSIVNTLTVTDDALQNLTITGDKALTLDFKSGTGAAEHGMTIDGSAATGALTIDMVVSDGLSTDAITVNYEEILPPLLSGLKQAGLKVGTPFFVRYGRVKIEDQIGEILGAKVVILLVGERPGLGQSESLSCYAVYSPRVATTVEADRTCISNIHQGGTPPVEAAAVIVDLAKRMLEQKASGINMTR